MKIIVTGGAGFIGSAVVRHLIAHTAHEVLVLDKLTYAGNLASLASVHGHRRYRFSRIDICDRAAIADAFASFDPDAVMHLAAESHVDRSIDGPAEFINTNVVGTYVLLEAALAHWRKRGRAPVPLPPHLDRRGLRRAHRRGPLHRGDALRPALALLGQQGGLRSPRARLGAHLWPARSSSPTARTTMARINSPKS